MSSTLFATSLISSAMCRLLTGDKYSRMLDAESLEDAVKVLYEVSYAGGQTLAKDMDYETLLGGEYLELIKFISSISPSRNVTNCFLLKGDYHNLKVMIKAKYLKLESYEDLLFPSAAYERSDLERAVFEENYVYVNEHMQGALIEIEKANLAGGINSAQIENAVNRAENKDLFAFIKKARNKQLKAYFVASVDLNNLAIVVRCAKLGGEAADEFMPNGSISTDELGEISKKSVEEFVNRFKYTEFSGFTECLLKVYEKSVGFYEYEKAVDNYLLAMYRKTKNDYFTINPVIGYFLAKQTELKNVRIILATISQKVDVARARERLRDSYV